MKPRMRIGKFRNVKEIHLAEKLTFFIQIYINNDQIQFLILNVCEYIQIFVAIIRVIEMGMSYFLRENVC